MIKVLVIDDDKLFCSAVQGYLESTGYAVHRCERGPDALSVLGYGAAHAIIVDCHLPEMDGARVAGMILNHYPEALIIGIS